MKHNEVVLDTSSGIVTLLTLDKIGCINLQLAKHQIPTGLVHSLDVDPLEVIPVVSNYPDVFPEELPGLPPDRAVEFSIDLIPGTAPVFHRPYKMPPNDLAE